jgi:hypothetical protein
MDAKALAIKQLAKLMAFQADTVLYSKNHPEIIY